MRGAILGLLLMVSVGLSSESIVLTALTYMERPYKFGANEIYRMDCSAFVQRVFKVNGIKLPRTAEEQASMGIPVSLTNIKPGDLLFFSTYKKGPSHVGIYIGNGKMVHASRSRGITIDRIDDPYWQKRFLFAKRLTGNKVVAKAKGGLDNNTYKKINNTHKSKNDKYYERDEVADLIFILVRAR